MKTRFTDEAKRKTLRTFFQAFIPCFTAGVVEALRDGGSLTWGAVIGFVLPAVAAGICAVMNLEADEDLPEEYDTENLEYEVNDID